MKKNIFGLFFSLIICFCFTGCVDGTFVIKCTSKLDDSTGVEVQNIVTYKFNKEQYATDYTAVTKQKFNDRETYEIYRDAQEQTVNDYSSDDISYSLKKDDKKMTLEFTLDFKNFDKEAKSDSDLEEIKASKILKKNEDNDLKCEVKGISRSKIK